MFTENPPGGLRQHTSYLCLGVCAPCHTLHSFAFSSLLPQHTLRSSFLWFFRWPYRLHLSTFNRCFPCTRSNLHSAHKKKTEKFAVPHLRFVCETTRCFERICECGASSTLSVATVTNQFLSIEMLCQVHGQWWYIILYKNGLDCVENERSVSVCVCVYRSERKQK